MPHCLGKDTLGDLPLFFARDNDQLKIYDNILGSEPFL